MASIRRARPFLATLAGLSALAAMPALAQEAVPAPDAAARRVEAVRALGQRLGDVEVDVANAFRFRGLMVENAREGVDAGRARAFLVTKGMAAQRADVAVRALMRADADGDGRVTLAEFEARQAALLGETAGAIRGIIPSQGTQGALGDLPARGAAALGAFADRHAGAIEAFASARR